MSDTFAAFTAENTDDGFRRGVTELTLDDLPADDVLVDVEWSSVNYKDALAATEKGRVARISPLVVGIDLAGHGAVERRSPAWPRATRWWPTATTSGCRTTAGTRRWHGYRPSGSCRCPPASPTREAMVVGTAGYTAALSVLALLDHGITPDAGTVLVTGATGGVGSMAVAMLAGLGFTVAASTGQARSRVVPPHARRE